MPKIQEHIEAEWQFDVDDLNHVETWIRDLPASVPIAITLAEPDEHVDTYFDTDDWRVYRSGYSLRMRRTQHWAELTLKAHGRREAGLAERLEITQRLPDTEADGIDQIGGPVGARVAAMRGRMETHALFAWITRRKRYRLWREGQNVGELALDHATVVGDSFEEQSQLLRVEVETSVDQIRHVRPFVDAMVSGCCLRPATGSKFATGASMLGLTIPQNEDVGTTRIDRDATIGELAFAVFRKQYQELVRHEPGTRLGDDPEELHDMRVAARRLRAAISLFKRSIDVDFEAIRSELSWVASALGDVRDLDVQLQELQRWKSQLDERDAAALDGLSDELGRRRDTARERMLSALDSDRYVELISRFGAMLRSGPGADASAPALVMAPELVLRRHRKFQRGADRLGRRTADAEFHAVRIDGKKLRYALEFVSPLYGKAAQQFIQDLTDVQDLLGRHQDSVIAIDHLREICVDAAEVLSAQTIFAMGRVAERYATSATESRNEFFNAYKRVSGKRWDRLERELRREAERRLRRLRSTDSTENSSPETIEPGLAG